MNLFRTALVAAAAAVSVTQGSVAGVRDTASFLSVPSTPTGTVRTFSVTTSYSVHQLVIEGTFTPNANYVQADQNRQKQEAVAQITLPSGEVVTAQLPATGGRRIVTFDPPVSSVGIWSARIFDTREDPDRDGLWSQIRFTLVDGPPAGAIEIGDLGTATLRSPRIIGGIRWHRFDIGGVFFNPEGSPFGFLDIDTEGSVGNSLTGSADIALYSASGTLIASDRSDGSGFQAQLTFGFHTGPRPAAAGSLPADGRDGLSLEPGVYYLAVGPANASFGPFGWNASAPQLATTGGLVVVNLRTHRHISVADFNRDGSVTAADLTAFTQAFTNGCP